MKNASPNKNNIEQNDNEVDCNEKAEGEFSSEELLYHSYQKFINIHLYFLIIYYHLYSAASFYKLVVKSQMLLTSHKERMLLTADVSKVLALNNHNNTWKNQIGNTTLNKIEKATLDSRNLMTEEQIDELFNKPKKKDQNHCWFTHQNRNFLAHLKFLKITNHYDCLLTGMPKQVQPNQYTNFEQGKENLGEDLTKKFKHNFIVGKIIGQGAYASVRVAVYKPLNRKIAIKVYDKARLKDNQRKMSVRREIQILQNLDHPNIMKIHDVVETNNHLNIVMEFLGGIPLNNYLKGQEHKRISERGCKKIFRGLAEALKYLHRMRIAHRDIKMENIILDESLSPKLIDFGFSTCIEASRKVKLFCGTPSYMAPEIVQKKEYRGQQADIWALGVLLFVCLTGLFPFKGATDQQLYSKINKVDYPKSELISFSKEVVDLISCLLKSHSQQRYSAEDMLQHPWLSMCYSNKKKSRGKKSTTNSSFTDNNRSLKHQKRLMTTTNISSQKSKESHGKKLTQTCNSNLKYQIKATQQILHNQQRNLDLSTSTSKKLNKSGYLYTILKELQRDNHTQKNITRQKQKENFQFKHNLTKDTKKVLMKKTRPQPTQRKSKQKKIIPDLRMAQMLRGEIKKREDKSRSRKR